MKRQNKLKIISALIIVSMVGLFAVGYFLNERREITKLGVNV